MNIYPIGYDFGNSDSCLVLIGQGFHVERQIPSISCSGSWKKVEATAKGAGKEVRDILQHNHYVLEYEAQDGRQIEKYIGQKVFDDGASPTSTRGDQARYWKNNYSLEMLMTSSASMIPDREYGLHVVTGIPISLYLDDVENANQVVQSLLGTHVFTFNNMPRTMHVLSVKVIMEGAGALIAYGSNEDVLQGVIDIGGHTTDLYMAKGQKPRAANSHGFKLGVASAADRFNEKFREDYGYTISLEGRMELLRQHVSGQQYRMVRDRDHNQIPDDTLAGLLESALRETGREIATQTAAAWSDVLMEIDHILIVGGGTHYFAQDIQERFKKAQCAYKPEMANAAGYARLAEAIAARMGTQPLRSSRSA